MGRKASACVGVAARAACSDIAPKRRLLCARTTAIALFCRLPVNREEGMTMSQQPIPLTSYVFEGSSTPQGAPPWKVTMDFSGGEATWSKTDGAHAVRLIAGQSVHGERIWLDLRGQDGIPDLIGHGTLDGMAMVMTCHASGPHPPERIAGNLRRR
jgi:hypothetical protein